ncbi:MAG: aspartate aminotransferase family protein [Anaerolineaceae bacterium]|nr:aspartate aminotransferase family protein [Anaerolineaceae bacterium]
MSVANQVLERYERVIFPAAKPYHEAPLVVSHAKDQYVWDVDDRRYLDFFGGVLTISCGHCNDEITQRVANQLRTLQHTTTLYVNEIMVQVAEKVAELTPGRLEKCYFTNSGSEAIETAILAARMYTGNSTVIALRHGYSGRTLQAMSLTAHSNWRLGNVVDANVRHVRNPYQYRAPEWLSEDELVELCVEDLEETIATTTQGKIAAFLAEPIQGVGGFVTPPKSYFERILPIVRKAGGVFIADEIQTGWGRTGGKWCGIEHWGVQPDIMTFAKGMANGTPIGCTVAIPEVADALAGSTFSTFGGNPVTMASALATIEYMEEHDLPTNAAVRGARLSERLEEFAQEFNFVGEARGMGLMQGLELVKPGGKEPDPARANAMIDAAKSRGLLIGKGGLYNNVLRIAPHLNVSAQDIETGCDIIAQALVDIS